MIQVWPSLQNIVLSFCQDLALRSGVTPSAFIYPSFPLYIALTYHHFKSIQFSDCISVIVRQMDVFFIVIGWCELTVVVMLIINALKWEMGKD